MAKINSIGILTSGGDAPGMNAAIRAVTRSAIYNGLKVFGIYRGYKGLVTDEIVEFKSQNVSNIIQMGGTILKTARCMEFKTVEGRQQAYENMKKHIAAYENAEELLEVFKSVKALSKATASPYKYVCDWFKMQFPDYKKAPVFKDGGLTVAPAKAPEIIQYKQKMSKVS